MWHSVYFMLYIDLALEEHIFQNEKYSQNIHCGSKFLELATESVKHYIKYHTCENTVGNRICHRHYYYTDKSRDGFCVVRKIDVSNRLQHQQSYKDEHGSGCCSGD